MAPGTGGGRRAAKARAVLVTGCSSGIGAAAISGLSARGFRVIASARKPADVQRLREAGVEALHLDYADRASIAAAAQAALEMTDGALYGLVNNGAYGQGGAVEDVPTEALRAQFEANFFGWHDLTCRLLPAMRARREGRIVQVSSILGLIALKYRGAYIASKFALEGMSDALRLELDGSGIQVALVEPGPIATRFTANGLETFRRNVDANASPHREAYARRMARLERGGATRFKLPPEAVVTRIAAALEAKRARPRYYVTVPTHVMGAARRLLPYRLLDRLLLAVSNAES